jgi:hypothetical protein
MNVEAIVYYADLENRRKAYQNLLDKNVPPYSGYKNHVELIPEAQAQDAPSKRGHARIESNSFTAEPVITHLDTQSKLRISEHKAKQVITQSYNRAFIGRKSFDVYMAKLTRVTGETKRQFVAAICQHTPNTLPRDCSQLKINTSQPAVNPQEPTPTLFGEILQPTNSNYGYAYYEEGL